MKKKKETRIKFIKNAKNKKIIIKILYGIFVICTIYNIIFLVNTTIKKQNYFDLMGISLLSMESNAMGKEIPKNALIITKKYHEYDKVNNNDNIAYIVNKKIRINKIINIKSDNGKIIYTTKSNNNYFADIEKISKNQIIGRVIYVIPTGGILLKILQSKITTVVIIVILLLKFSYNKELYRRRIKKNKKLKES